MKLSLNLLNQPATFVEEDTKLFIEVNPTGTIISEFGEMEGGKHVTGKLFTCKNSPRNWFTLDVLTGGKLNGWSNRYLKGAKLPIEYIPTRPSLQHQPGAVIWMATRLQCVNAGEMGVGKTFMLFEAIDFARLKLKMSEGVVWWVGPRSALTSLETQIYKWKFYLRGTDRIFTYNALEKEMENATDWPQHVVFDESAALKNPGSRRTQLAIQLAIEMDRRWKDRCTRLLCSGSPQPESYFDWWSQCEVARPGWLRESSRVKFERRLAVFSFVDKAGGGVYPEFKEWRAKEVELLPKRLDGLVLPMWKKDVMAYLPEKMYEVITLSPSSSTLRVARHLAKTTPRAKLNQKLRQLSDGFQYVSAPDTETEDDDGDDVDTSAADLSSGRVQEGETPKDQLLKDLLEKYTPAKRFVVYAAYQASVDRVARICAAEGWKVWQYDGRGNIGGVTEDQFNNYQGSEERIVFVGNPESAGQGLTLSGSPAIFYYSNSFKGQFRTQSEDRINRPGATKERGCTIIDCVHLPTDAKVIEAVKAKRNAEKQSLEEVLALLGGGPSDAR